MAPRERSSLSHDPRFTVIRAAITLDPATVEDQEQAACADIADGVRRALTRLSPHHPHRTEYLMMLADFRAAAGPRAERSFVLAG